MCDVAALLAAPGVTIDWPALIARASAWHAARGVYLTLALARDRLGAEVPPAVLDVLEPSACEPALVALAERQLFASRADTGVPGEISRLAVAQSFWSRLGRIRQRVFIEPAYLAAIYGRSPDMPFAERVFWRGVRLKDLLKLHAPTVLRLRPKHGGLLVETAEAQQRLRLWLLS